jgi:hypothetical protein
MVLSPWIVSVVISMMRRRTGKAAKCKEYEERELVEHFDFQDKVFLRYKD